MIKRKKPGYLRGQDAINHIYSKLKDKWAPREHLLISQYMAEKHPNARRIFFQARLGPKNKEITLHVRKKLKFDDFWIDSEGYLVLRVTEEDGLATDKVFRTKSKKLMFTLLPWLEKGLFKEKTFIIGRSGFEHSVEII